MKEQKAKEPQAHNLDRSEHHEIHLSVQSRECVG